MPEAYIFRQLGPDDLSAVAQLMRVFGDVFEEPATYTGKPPSPAYLRGLLESDTFLALVAEKDGAVVGGIAAYELKKFEQERNEIYLYDLAVLEEHRRRGLATGLIRTLQRIGADRGAHLVFVQAHTGPEDEAAIALYSGLGTREEILHFELEVEGEVG